MDGSRFVDLFGPPQSPPVPIDWAVVESWLGLRLPADYKAIGSLYGPLDIGEYVWLQLPRLDPLDDPLEFADFEPWTDASYW